MKILYDHQIFSLQRYGGVSKYFCELIKRLPPQDWETSVFLSNNEYAISNHLFTTYPFMRDKTFRGKERLMVELGMFYSIYKIRKSNFDVLHQTDYHPYCFKYLKNKPIVTTCHDMNFVTYNPCHRLASWQRESVLKADGVIAISEYTKQKLLELYPVSSQKIQVIYHGVTPVYYDPAIYPPLCKYPYLLFVGTRFSFKNFDKILIVFKELLKKYKGLRLICTGNQFSKSELRLLQDLKILDSVDVVSANEMEMSILYRDALAFVFPSLSEGFGMPLLEAMAQGCPVVCSNTSCFPEIAGEAASYFDPHSIEDMGSAIEKVINEEAYRQGLISRGNRRVSEFTWEKSVEKHLLLYKSFL